MKLLVIGNSHTAMIAKAATDGKVKGHDLTFFARAGSGPEGVEFDGPVIRACDPDLCATLDTLGMPSVVNMADFDGVLVVGMAAAVYTTVSLTVTHSVLGWPVPVTTALIADRPPISEGLMEDMVEERVQRGQAWRYVNAIKSACDVPVVVVAQPCPRSDITLKRKRQSFAKMVARGEGPNHLRVVETVQKRLFESHTGVRFLSQRPETLVDGCLTLPKFGKGSRQLNTALKQKDSDVLHANSAYGALVLSDAISALQDLRTS